MSRTISQLTAGTEIFIDETVNSTTEHIPYIYLGLDASGKAIALRRYVEHTGKMDSSSGDYGTSECDAWLNNTSTGFLSRFDASTLNALDNTSISYVNYKGLDDTVQLITIARKCFLLSQTEYGNTATSAGSEGSSYVDVLKAFYNTTSADTSRIARTTNQTDRNQWTRSSASTSLYRIVLNTGKFNTLGQANTTYYFRPALSINPNTIVSDEGAESIFLLPDGRITTWGVEAQMSLGKTNSMPIQCKLVVPTDIVDTMQCWVCNNYGDVSPTWVPCTNGGVATFGTTKTADDWELGVKVNAQYNVQGRAIGEPAMIVKFGGGE